MNAASPYQVRYWLQEAINEARNAYYAYKDFTSAELDACFGGHVLYLRRIHRLAVKGFDFLETKQEDILLA